MTTWIRCDGLFDGEGMVDGALVALEGERITEVLPRGTASAAEVPSEEEVLHVPFLMPGLIDCHVHLEGYAEGSPAGAPFQPVKSFLRLLIYNGVTTVRDVGNSLETIDYLRRWGEKFHSTEVLSCGPVLDVPPLTWTFSRIVDAPEQIPREIELLALEGIDFVKAEPNLSPELLEALVQAAGEHDLQVACQPGRTSAVTACELGVRSLERLEALVKSLGLETSNLEPGSPAEEELLTALGGGTFVCPTLFAHHREGDLEAAREDPHLELMTTILPYHKYLQQMGGLFGKSAALDNLRPYLRQDPATTNGRPGRRALDDLTRRLAGANVPLVAGSGAPGTGVIPGFSLHHELAALASAGLDPLTVLQSATSQAARLLQREDLGRIAPGAQADLLLLNTDPTRDIASTLEIREVFKRGHRVDREKTLGYVEAMLD
ncbi:MAG: amidohydrolase family protein [Acidobacteriota bacterium]|nr:amidohydrolase family protein [Acidobacteriota bacterium]